MIGGFPTEVNTYLGSLRHGQESLSETADWVRRSWEDPAGFLRSLKRVVDSLHPVNGASTLFRNYDFYHDIARCNRSNPHAAMSWHTSQGEERGLSFRELDEVASEKAAYWRSIGVRQGQVLCLLRSLGPDFATDLLAGLRLGLILSVLPLPRRRYVLNRLERLKPDFITTDTPTARRLGAWAGAVLPSMERPPGEAFTHRSFHGYAAGETVFRLFPAASSSGQDPVDVTSDSAYLSALRDGVLFLGLSPGKVVAYPGADLLETQPAYLLSSLLCGATVSLVSPGDEQAMEGAVQRAGVHVLGVTPSFRDLLLHAGARYRGGLEAWFRCPVASFDMDRWQALSQLPLFAPAYALNLRWDAALGGCILCSDGQTGVVSSRVYPPPGSCWTLEEAPLIQPGELSVDMVSTQNGAGSPTGVVVSPLGKGFHCVGCVSPTRFGASYPVDELLAFLQAHAADPLHFFSLCASPRADFKGGEFLTLLIFLGPDREAGSAQSLIARYRRLIESEFGETLMPDAFRWYPLFPKGALQGEVDHPWCREAFLSGRLDRMSQGALFQCMARLRAHLMSPPRRVVQARLDPK